jgi:manganese transport protein
MGVFVNGALTRVVAVIGTAVVLVLNIILIAQTLM